MGDELTANCAINSLKPYSLHINTKTSLQSREFKGHWQINAIELVNNTLRNVI